MMVLVLAVALGLVAGPALAGDKLICVSSKGLKGEVTVGQCLAKGEDFAVIDKTGVPRILNKAEIEILKKTNPGLLDMKAFSIEFMKDAPVIAPPGAS